MSVSNGEGQIYRCVSHHSFRQLKQSEDCLAFAEQFSFSQSLNKASSFLNSRNWPSTTYAYMQANRDGHKWRWPEDEGERENLC